MDLNKEALAPKDTGDGSIIYTCPMYPEIRQVHTGQRMNAARNVVYPNGIIETLFQEEVLAWAVL